MYLYILDNRPKKEEKFSSIVDKKTASVIKVLSWEINIYIPRLFSSLNYIIYSFFFFCLLFNIAF